MSTRYDISLFIFRRDLRLDDNAGLMAALAQSRRVIPCFIFDPRQIDLHPYRGEHALQFMLESLEDLAGQLRDRGGKLYTFSDYPHTAVEKLIHYHRVEAVFVNRDYTPFSIARDEDIESVCEERRVGFYQFADALLTEPESVLKSDGTPYTVYTPFARKARTWLVSDPSPHSHANYYAGDIDGHDDSLLDRILPDRSPSLFARGGSAEADKRMAAIADFGNYEAERNIPSIGGTTGLSAHLKFGTLSIRRIYHAVANQFGAEHPIVRQLYWRDFFTHVAFHYPRVFGQAFHRKYDSLPWSTDTAAFRRWCSGQTGFPIVDAGMRQLNATGWMHNRVRMIVASFLTKDLHIDWRLGERYFAQQLIDYDPSVNNGNWQWAASTGCDATPYFRIFNPWLQQKRFDPDCHFIKTWIPELRHRVISAETIHTLHSSERLIPDYPKPMVDHRVESEKARMMFSQINFQTPGGSI